MFFVLQRWTSTPRVWWRWPTTRPFFTARPARWTSPSSEYRDVSANLSYLVLTRRYDSKVPLPFFQRSYFETCHPCFSMPPGCANQDWSTPRMGLSWKFRAEWDFQRDRTPLLLCSADLHLDHLILILSLSVVLRKGTGKHKKCMFTGVIRNMSEV